MARHLSHDWDQNGLIGMSVMALSSTGGWEGRFPHNLGGTEPYAQVMPVALTNLTMTRLVADEDRRAPRRAKGCCSWGLRVYWQRGSVAGLIQKKDGSTGG